MNFFVKIEKKNDFVLTSDFWLNKYLFLNNINIFVLLNRDHAYSALIHQKERLSKSQSFSNRNGDVISRNNTDSFLKANSSELNKPSGPRKKTETSTKTTSAKRKHNEDEDPEYVVQNKKNLNRVHAPVSDSENDEMATNTSEKKSQKDVASNLATKTVIKKEFDDSEHLVNNFPEAERAYDPSVLTNLNKNPNSCKSGYMI